MLREIAVEVVEGQAMLVLEAMSCAGRVQKVDVEELQSGQGVRLALDVNTDPFERRCALVLLMFTSYETRLPSGVAFPPPEEWPQGWIESMADTPPVKELDRYIAHGMETMTAEVEAAWQAERS